MAGWIGEHLAISTHSLTRRLTIMKWKCIWRKQISTHSLTRRLTHRNRYQITFHLHFNSQPHKEADRKHAFPLPDKRISTHSLTRRLTISVRDILMVRANFNSQPHKEADSDAVL